MERRTGRKFERADRQTLTKAVTKTVTDMAIRRPTDELNVK